MIPITIRVSEDIRRKLRVIAGYKDASLNGVITDAIEEKVIDWEKKHGVIAIPNEK